jgi:O-antigen/teichoic acid export membrane protein
MILRQLTVSKNLFNYILRFCAILSVFIFHVSLSKLASPEIYGDVVTQIALSLILSVIFRFGLENIIVFDNFDNFRNKSEWSILSLSVISFVALYIVSPLNIHFLNISIDKSVVIGSTMLATNLFAAQYFRRLGESEKMFIVCQIIPSILATIAVFIFSKYGEPTIEIYLYLYFLSFFPSVFILIHKISLYSPYTGSKIKGGFFLSNYLNSLINVIWQNIDIFLIGYFLDVTTAGVYFLSLKIANLAGLPLLIHNSRFVPLMSKAERYNNYMTLDKIKKMFYESLLVSLLIVVFSYINIFSLNINLYVIVFILLSHIVANSIGPVGQFLIVKRKIVLSNHLMLIGLIVNASLTILLVREIGVVGAGISTALGYIAWRVFGRFYVDKVKNA